MAVMNPATPNIYAQESLIDNILNETTAIVSVHAQKISIDHTVQPATVQIQEQSGAGVIIEPSGYIVTNTHTILYADHIYVTLSNGSRFEATISAIAPETDFTILKINAPYALKTLSWANPQLIALGTEIISIGNSALWKETICGGTITGIANNISKGTIGLMEMDFVLDRGDSGGPVLDRQGRFLGIIVAKNTKKQRSSYALPAWDIREFFLNYLNERQIIHAQ